MSSTPGSSPINELPNDKDDSSLAKLESSVSGSWLTKLPGIDQADLNAIVGRQRLSQALDLEQKQDNRYLRLSLYLLGAAAVLFVPLAALTPITQVVQASGQVIPRGSVNVIQHLEGGIVAKVNVLDGDQVKKGQVLLELNPQLVGSAYDAAEQELENLVIQQKQLQAAIDGKEKIELNDSTFSNAKVEQTQQELLSSRMNNRQDQINAYQASVQEKEEEVRGLTNQIRYMSEEVEMWEKLTKSGP